ncbi:coiled-coil domain-containing protein 177-like isoform X1 [Pomacea canaliculata]|uniref:coiled-coil domain-containing protein 177-like isoform X1 n=1 Tax=Pomacea canaliculata TaxID=400727 RepID=UPI000D73F2D1|nr:coiled-coil domain-containing protein 177-like isoform X1 [Pomacea canaliculata]
MKSAESEEGSLEKIDLYNFELPEFENSRYVLTSPRSLEACSRLNVKPVELLYKPLSEFQEELLPQDVPLRTIYNIFDEQEQIRQRKLQLCQEERSRVTKEDIRDKSSFSSKMGTKIIEKKDLSKGSLQRQRTAWATRVMQKPLLKDENSHSTQNYNESDKLRHELLSRKENKLKHPARKTRSAKSTPRTAHPDVCVRSKSVSDIYSSLPAKDRKILELMQSKWESERQRLETSERTRLLWEDEKKRQEVLRAVMENKRRSLLAKENKVRDDKKFEEKQQQKKIEQKALSNKEDEIVVRARRSDEELYRHLKMQELKLAGKRNKDELKKRIQERNLEQQNKDKEDIFKRAAELSKTSLSQAEQRRELALVQQSFRKSMTNHEERQAFEKRCKEMNKDLRRSKQGVLCLNDLRHSQAEENLVQLLETRNRQLLSSHLEKEKKLDRARQTQQQLEEEMESWRRSLLQHKKQVEEQAAKAARINQNNRSQRARMDRLTHEEEHKKNLQKLLRDHERWRRNLEELLDEKDKRMDEIQLQKEKSIMETRAMAQITHALRDKLRKKYESDTFDRKVLDAQLFAKLESRPPFSSLSASASSR